MDSNKDDFFKEVETITHNVNLCLEAFFDDKGDISGISLYKDSLPHTCLTKSDLTPIFNFISLHNLSLSNSGKANLKAGLPVFLSEIEEKYKALHLPHPSVKMIIILDAKTLILKHWTSLPVLNNTGQVKEYFDSVLRFGNMALSEEEQGNLQDAVNKILSKMLGEI